MKLPMFAVAALAAAAAAFTGSLGLASEAGADYSAKVDKDTLNVVGDDAGDKLTLYADQTNVLVDVAEDGTIDFTFDRAAFTAIFVKAQGGDDQVRVAPRAFQHWSVADHAWRAEPGTFRVTAGPSVMDQPLPCDVEVTQEPSVGLPTDPPEGESPAQAPPARGRRRAT